MSEFVFVYSTFPNAESARKAAQLLVAARLAACVNIYPIESVYEWQGKLEDGPEAAVFIKTRRALAEQVIAAARAVHPYSVPCFLTLPIEAGNDDYLSWARAQTAQP